MQPIIEVILKLQSFILFCICIVLPLSLALIWKAGRFKWKDSAYFGMLFELNRKSCLFLSVEVLSFLLLLWIVIIGKADYIYVIMVSFLMVIGAILNPVYKRIPLQLINGSMSVVALVLASILLDYSRFVQFNFNLVILYYLIGLFVLLYNAYNFIKMLEELSKTRKERDYHDEA